MKTMASQTNVSHRTYPIGSRSSDLQPVAPRRSKRHSLLRRVSCTRDGVGGPVCASRASELCELEHTGYGIQLPGFDMIIVIRMAAGACGISSIHKGGTPCSVASLCIESEVGLPKRMRGAFQAYAQERTGQPGRVSCDDPDSRPASDAIGYPPSCTRRGHLPFLFRSSRSKSQCKCVSV